MPLYQKPLTRAATPLRSAINMKPTLLILSLFALTLFSNGEETPIELARRVIRDKSSVYSKLQPISPNMGRISYRDPSENRLVDAADQSGKIIEEHFLNDDTPERVLLAYAIRVLQLKRIPWETNPNMLGVDTKKNQGYLDDGLKLAKRLDEIKKEAQGGADQPATAPELKSEGKDKPKPEAEVRPR